MIGYAVAVWAVAIIGGYLPYIGEGGMREGGKEAGRQEAGRQAGRQTGRRCNASDGCTCTFQKTRPLCVVCFPVGGAQSRPSCSWELQQTAAVALPAGACCSVSLPLLPLRLRLLFLELLSEGSLSMSVVIDAGAIPFGSDLRLKCMLILVSRQL